MGWGSGGEGLLIEGCGGCQHGTQGLYSPCGRGSGCCCSTAAAAHPAELLPRNHCHYCLGPNPVAVFKAVCGVSLLK